MLGELLFDGNDLRDGVEGTLFSDGSAWLPPSSPPSSSSSSDDDGEPEDELEGEDDGGGDDDVFDFDDEDVEGTSFPCLGGRGGGGGGGAEYQGERLMGVEEDFCKGKPLPR